MTEKIYFFDYLVAYFEIYYSGYLMSYFEIYFLKLF